MQVKELIRRLKKQHPEAVVIWQDHDQTEDEVAGDVVEVEASDSEILKERFGPLIVTLR